MATHLKERFVSFRVSEEEYDLLSSEAEKRKLSNGQTARMMVLYAVSGFDQKQETIMRRLDYIDDKFKESFQLLLDISSLGAAAGALPLDAEQQDVPALREKLKIHFQHSSDLGKSLVNMIKKGKL